MRTNRINQDRINEAHAAVANGESIDSACKKAHISTATFYKRKPMKPINGPKADKPDNTARVLGLERLCAAQAKLLATYGLRVEICD